MTTAADTRRDLERMRTRIRDMNGRILASVTQDAYESITIGRPDTGAPGQPVDTGYLRNSWSLFTDTVGTFRTAGDGKDNAGTSEAPLAAPSPNPAVLLALAMGRAHVVTIATNTAYAEVQEYNHPTHAASVRLTAAGLPALGAKAFRQVTGGGGGGA